MSVAESHDEDNLPGRHPGNAGAGELISGGCIPGLARPAFTLQRAVSQGIPVLIAVPHAGRAYPPALLQTLRHGEVAAQRLEDRFVDAIGRAAAAACNASLMIAHAPRALIDLNRDMNDLDDGMFTGSPPSRRPEVSRLPRQQPRAPRGLGLFPRRLNGLGELWRNPMHAAEAEQRIAAVHIPYHTQIEAELGRLRAMHGRAILVDLHSMPSLQRHGRNLAATHVIGDRFGASCASAVSAAAMDMLQRCSVLGAYNRPYAGGYVLDRHGRPRSDIHALQLEIDRGRYLDESGHPRSDAIVTEARLVSELARLLTSVLSGGGWGVADAAE